MNQINWRQKIMENFVIFCRAGIIKKVIVFLLCVIPFYSHAAWTEGRLKGVNGYYAKSEVALPSGNNKALFPAMTIMYSCFPEQNPPILALTGQGNFIAGHVYKTEFAWSGSPDFEDVLFSGLSSEIIGTPILKGRMQGFVKRLATRDKFLMILHRESAFALYSFSLRGSGAAIRRAQSKCGL